MDSRCASFFEVSLRFTHPLNRKEVNSEPPPLLLLFPHPHQPKNRFRTLAQLQPSKRSRCSFIRQPRRAWVQKPNPLDLLIPRHVGMSVQKKFHPRGNRRGRNMQ